VDRLVRSIPDVKEASGDTEFSDPQAETDSSDRYGTDASGSTDHRDTDRDDRSPEEKKEESRFTQDQRIMVLLGRMRQLK